MEFITLGKPRYYKIILSNYCSIPINYHQGLNELPTEYSIDNHYNGIYFTSIRHLFRYVYYGPIVAEIIVPDDATVIEAPECMGCGNLELTDGWRANKIFITQFYDITDPEVFLYFIKKGAEVDYDTVKWALFRAPKIWDLLIKMKPYCDMCKLVFEDLRNKEKNF